MVSSTVLQLSALCAAVKAPKQETCALYEKAQRHDAEFKHAHERGDPKAAYHAMDALQAQKNARELEHIDRLGVYGLMGVIVLLLFIAAKLA